MLRLTLRGGRWGRRWCCRTDTTSAARAPSRRPGSGGSESPSTLAIEAPERVLQDRRHATPPVDADHRLAPHAQRACRAHRAHGTHQASRAQREIPTTSRTPAGVRSRRPRAGRDRRPEGAAHGLGLADSVARRAFSSFESPSAVSRRRSSRSVSSVSTFLLRSFVPPASWYARIAIPSATREIKKANCAIVRFVLLSSGRLSWSLA